MGRSINEPRTLSVLGSPRQPSDRASVVLIMGAQRLREGRCVARTTSLAMPVVSGRSRATARHRHPTGSRHSDHRISRRPRHPTPAPGTPHRRRSGTRTADAPARAPPSSGTRTADAPAPAPPTLPARRPRAPAPAVDPAGPAQRRGSVRRYTPRVTERGPAPPDGDQSHRSRNVRPVRRTPIALGIVGTPTARRGEQSIPVLGPSAGGFFTSDAPRSTSGAPRSTSDGPRGHRSNLDPGGPV